MDDRELLKSYVRTGSQIAFRRLVDRHVNLVYSAALRQVRGDTHLAEDVTQTVFLTLSLKAPALADKTVLAGWLFETARYAAANALKAQARRSRRETRKAEMDTPRHFEDPAKQDRDAADWEQISPVLDGALAALGPADRDAVLLRYIQGKSHQDVAGVLGITAEAARKRIDRALDKLRGHFLRSGVTLSAGGLATLLSTHAASAAPAGLSTAIIASLGTAGATAATTAFATPTLAKGTLAIFAWAKAHAVACGLAAAVMASSTVVLVQQLARAQSKAAAPQLPLQAVAQQPAAPQPDAQPAPKEIDIDGLIRTPDGNPAAGAEVFVAMPESDAERTRMRQLQARIQAGERVRPDEWNRRQDASVDVYNAQWPQATQATDQTGRFSYGGLREPWTLVARHASGFLQVTHDEFKDARGQLSLQPWGRVEGRLMIGDKPQPNQKVVLFRSGSQHEWEAMQVRHARHTTTDPQGNFVFEDVAPGDSWIAWEPTGKRLQRIRHTLVDVEPGKPTLQDIGGSGRPVIGRAAITPSNAPDVKLSWDRARNQNPSSMYSRIEGTRLGFVVPPGFERMTPAEQTKLRRQWEKTPEGRKSLRHSWGEDFDINPDGSFRIDDLAPGQYNLQLRILRTENGFGEDLVECNTTFTVPPLPEGVKRLDEPLDIGEVPVKLKERTEPGKPAPDFTATTLDGKPLKLSDHKGKYVMLKWWWQWTEMDVEAPAMRKAHAAMEEDPRKEWVLINVAFDQEIETTRKRAADHQLPGIHCHVQGQDKFPRAYMGSPSTICIIAPDGKVLRRNVQTLQAETEIAKINIEKQ